MAQKRSGILEVFRLLNEDPVTMYRDIGQQDGFRLRRALFNNFATVTDPDHVRHVLVTNAGNYRKTPIARALLEPILGRGLLTSEGSFWRRQRRIAAPAFHHKRIRTFAAMMVEETQAMLAGWREAAAAGRTIDIRPEMSRVTMQIITRSMFSHGLSEADARGVSDAIRSLSGNQLRFRDLIGLPEWLPRFPRAEVREAVRAIRGTVDRIIAERRADGGDHGDLLGMMMLARDEETGETMTDRQLRDEVVTVFIAGHETTATALTWTFYALDKHRAVEERLHKELDGVLRAGAPGLDDLDRIPYARMVIEETMRLYPTVPQIARQAIGEDRIDGVRVPPGAIINMNIWLTHRNPDIWVAPEAFDPGRFDPSRTSNRHKLAYFPFGGGARACIGSSFAMMEAHLILATVAQAWRLRLPQGHQVHPIGNVVLRPKGGLPMHLEARAPRSIH
ncbi:MAG: cytochrome P450 [Alphaproteobacteria bacterium]|jgi:cytochrome P450|nr:cytochrome P450 [Alphaproteobacteria bacterium]